MKLRWLTANSLELQYSDGTRTKIPLVQEEPTPCLFTGSLDDDPDSRVTVSGCEGDEETIVTIGSVKVGRTILNQ